LQESLSTNLQASKKAVSVILNILYSSITHLTQTYFGSSILQAPNQEAQAQLVASDERKYIAQMLEQNQKLLRAGYV
jgi:hypothetical protein